jgi:ORF6N domain
MARVSEKIAPLEPIAAPAIEKRILVVRGRQVMLDEGLADFYGVETLVLVQQVKRNAKRFPEDFLFQLTSVEAETRAGAAAATRPMSLRSRDWRCSPASFAVTERLP